MLQGYAEAASHANAHSKINDNNITLSIDHMKTSVLLLPQLELLLLLLLVLLLLTLL